MQNHFVECYDPTVCISFFLKKRFIYIYNASVDINYLLCLFSSNRLRTATASKSPSRICPRPLRPPLVLPLHQVCVRACARLFTVCIKRVRVKRVRVVYLYVYVRMSVCFCACFKLKEIITVKRYSAYRLTCLC